MHPKTWLHKLLCALCVQRLSAGTDTMYIKVDTILKFPSGIFFFVFVSLEGEVALSNLFLHPKTWLHKLLCVLRVQRLNAGTEIHKRHLQF